MTRPAPARRRAAPARAVEERAAIACLERLFGATGPEVELGIGDDAAILRWAGDRVVWTVDACVEGVHFDRGWLALGDVGWRSFHAALSDLGAMGARPVAALSSLVLPAGTTRADLVALGRGQAAAARSLGCPIVGGNVSNGDVLSVTTTAIGAVRRGLTRSGARPGDGVWLLGDVGLAAAGLRLLRDGSEAWRSARAGAACVRAWRRPRARVAEGLEIGRVATAAIDVSDGLGGDVGQLASASGVRVVLDEAALRRTLRPELVAVSAAIGLDPLALALEGGEDYALVVTTRRRCPHPASFPIGRVEAGRGAFLARPEGTLRRLGPGFEHGSRPGATRTP